jgi:hypothetical protein
MYLIASEGKHSIRAFIQIYYPQKAQENTISIPLSPTEHDQVNLELKQEQIKNKDRRS